MAEQELHSGEDARRWLLQGLWFQRLQSVRAEAIPQILGWLLELAVRGDPLPPSGFVADVGHLAIGLDGDSPGMTLATAVTAWPTALVRSYEDYVLGKLYADWTFERASAALRRYQGRDRARAVAFLFEQCQGRHELPGKIINPAMIKGLLEQPPDALLREGWEGLMRLGLEPGLVDLYSRLIVAIRDSGDFLGAEDVFELEHGTAVAAFSQRLALRQVLQATTRLLADLPRQPPRQVTRHQEVPTPLHSEDTYPVGGFSSIGTRGSVESLLHSQLVYMEKHERPDLFDIKFVRDELLYYARDENEFLRRRRTFIFAFFPDLSQARYKDADLVWQRLVLLLAFVAAAMRKLTEWLDNEALHFDLVFVEEDEVFLSAEQAVLEMLLREELANGTATIARSSAGQLAAHCAERARRSQCEVLTLSKAGQPLGTDAARLTIFQLDGPVPKLGSGQEPAATFEEDTPLASWGAALEWLLERWL